MPKIKSLACPGQHSRRGELAFACLSTRRPGCSAGSSYKPRGYVFQQHHEGRRIRVLSPQRSGVAIGGLNLGTLVLEAPLT